MKDLPRNEIVFVLNNLSDLQTLVSGVPDGAEMHVLDASGDALAQVAALLDGRSGIEALHLLCHGSPGALHMGSATLERAHLCVDSSGLGGFVLPRRQRWRHQLRARLELR